MSQIRNATETPQPSSWTWHIMPAFVLAAALHALFWPVGNDAAPSSGHVDAAPHHALLLTPSAQPGEGEPAIVLADIAQSQWY